MWIVNQICSVSWYAACVYCSIIISAWWEITRLLTDHKSGWLPRYVCHIQTEPVTKFLSSPRPDLIVYILMLALGTSSWIGTDLNPSRHTDRCIMFEVCIRRMEVNTIPPRMLEMVGRMKLQGCPDHKLPFAMGTLTGAFVFRYLLLATVTTRYILTSPPWFRLIRQTNKNA